MPEVMTSASAPAPAPSAPGLEHQASAVSNGAHCGGPPAEDERTVTDGRTDGPAEAGMCWTSWGSSGAGEDSDREGRGAEGEEARGRLGGK